MRITEGKLRQIIREERRRLAEGSYSGSTGSALIDFAQAYASLGSVVAGQVDYVVQAYNDSNGDPLSDIFLDAIDSHAVNPSAIDLAMSKIGHILRRGQLGDEGDLVLEALDAAMSNYGP